MKKKFSQKDLFGKRAEILTNRIEKWEKEYYNFSRDLLDYNLTRILRPIHKLLKRRIKVYYDYKFIYQKKKSLSIGKSKLGGYPDLPSDFEWPYWKNKPLDYVLQLNLKEITNLKGCRFVKKEGMIYLFYHFKSKFQDHKSKDKGRWGVFYHPSINDLVRVKDLPYKLPHSPLSDVYPMFFKDKISIPSPSAIDNTRRISGLFPFIIDSLRLNEKEKHEYHDLYHLYQGDQLFGYPSYEDGNSQLECELRYNNLSPKDYSWRKHSFVEAKNWTLLFEIHDKYHINWDFGEGIVYTFWIREEDLQKNNFDIVWANFESRRY